MRIALVDDQPLETELLADMIADAFNKLNLNIDTVDSFLSGEEFLNSWNEGKYDIIVLDMYMNGISGVEVARKVRETDINVKLVFCTTSNDFASESYSVSASYYLLKPVTSDAISAMIQKINPEDYELLRYTTLPDGQTLILRNIIFSEYYNHTILIHTKKGDDIKTRLPQAEFEKLICDYPFLLVCAKGVIVNLYEVSSVGKDVFVMSNGLFAPISRRRAKESEATYNGFLFDKLRGDMRR